ncbi:hypothetical protein ACO0QE_000586 [Hanseniaspora vineae]
MGSTFGQKIFRSKRQEALYNASIAGKYRKAFEKRPFFFFGLPFLTIIGLSSYWLSGLTSVRYEKHDAKQCEIDAQELIDLPKRKFDLKEEYYRLQGIGLDDWEQKRVPRMKGESDNVFD